MRLATHSPPLAAFQPCNLPAGLELSSSDLELFVVAWDAACDQHGDVGGTPEAEAAAADRGVVNRYDDTQCRDHFGAGDVGAQGQAGEVGPQQLRKRGHVIWVKGDGGMGEKGALILSSRVHGAMESTERRAR